MLNMKLLKTTALSVISSKNLKEIDDENFMELKKFLSIIDDSFLNVNVLNLDGAINHYDRITKCIVFDCINDKINAKGSYSTFFHELGHHIDWELSLVSDDDNFRRFLIKEGNNFLASIDISKLLLFIYTEARTSGLSDILSAITLNKYKFKYKHSNKYWLSTDNKICFETFAHFFEAYGRKDKFKMSLYKTIFPLSYKMFLYMLNNKNSAKANIA